MFRVGLLDVIAVVLLAVTLLLPGRVFLVEPVFAGDVDDADLRLIARAQRDLASDPGNGRVAAELAGALRRLDMHAVGLRIAGDVFERSRDWRAALAVSSLHADRVEVEQAYEYARRALEACERDPESCPAHEQVRMRVYHDGLKAGLDSGVDPRREPERFREEVLKAFPTVRFRSR